MEGMYDMWIRTHSLLFHSWAGRSHREAKAPELGVARMGSPTGWPFSQGLPVYSQRRLPNPLSLSVLSPAVFAAPAGRFLTLGADVWSAGCNLWCGHGGAGHRTLGAEQGQREPSRLGSNRKVGISHRPTRREALERSWRISGVPAALHGSVGASPCCRPGRPLGIFRAAEAAPRPTRGAGSPPMRLRGHGGDGGRGTVLRWRAEVCDGTDRNRIISAKNDRSYS